MPLLRSRCHALTRHDPIRQPIGMNAMRIAQVAPLAESVPPKLYGGTERVVSWLTEQLVEQGIVNVERCLDMSAPGFRGVLR